jgi:hypothetical protein
MDKSSTFRTNAQRQAAYRKRCRQATDDQIKAKGLPKLPTVDTIAGWDRWNKAMRQIETLTSQIQSEMESYYDDRSEQWQESDRGTDFQEKLEGLTEILDAVSEWPTL